MLVEIDRPHPQVLRLALSRPGEMNTFDRPMAEALGRALEAGLGDPAVRAIILTGAGGQFSAGGKIDWMRDQSPDALKIYHRDVLGVLRRLALAAKPTVAAIEGVCIGGGAGFALACDYVVMGEGARLGIPFLRIALVPDMATAYFIARRTSPQVAKRLSLENRVVKAGEAFELGLADVLVSDAQVQDRAVALASELAALPPRAVAQTKELLGHMATPFDEYLAAELAAQSVCIDGPEFSEGCAAFFEKRIPRY